MKKKYVSPRLYTELFQMTQSIALNCGWDKNNSSLGKPGHPDKDTCGWDVGGTILWPSEPTCTEIIGVNDDVNGICYNNPNGGHSIFAS